jgi:sulfur carrier protein ThiS adenylyltransferase
MTIRIRVNERDVEIASDRTVHDVRQDFKPDADVLVLNGFPGKGHERIKDGDAVVLIRRGEIPEPDELEALLVSRHTPGVHQKIKEARVGVAGLGGLGSQVAIAMARLGIGSLVLADFDVVEPSNLNRQQYFVDQMGMPKVEALRATLERANPCVAIECHDTVLTANNIPQVFADCRILIEAFDRASEKEMLIKTALDHMPDTIVVAASGLAGYEPSDSVVVHRLSSKLFVVGDLETAAGPGVGLMAPRVGVAAHTQANLALRLLLGVEQ